MHNLDFLNNMFSNKKDIALKSDHLNSLFNENIWSIHVSSNILLNFNIYLSDGSLLTDSVNESILNTIKLWIITCLNDSSGIKNSKANIYKKLLNVITLIDYLILKNIVNKKDGFKNIHKDNIKHFLTIISQKSKFDSIYDVSKKLSVLLIEKSKDIAIEDINLILSNNNIFPSFVGSLNLNEIERNKIVAFLHIEKKYKTYSSNNHRKNPNLTSYIKECLQNTLASSLATIKYDLYDELSITSSSNNFVRQFETAGRKEKTTNSSSRLISYLKIIQLFNNLYNVEYNDLKLSLPLINIFKNFEFNSDLSYYKGRFETVPVNNVFYSIRKAIELHIEYSEHIFNSFSNIIEYMNKNNFDDVTQINDNEFSNLLTPYLIDKGINCWTKKRNQKNADKFEKNSFNTLLNVYFAAVQVVVGALMARRQSELISLKSGDCIYNEHLIFNQSKSSKGLFGTRDTLALPIDKLAVTMVKNIEKIHSLIYAKNIPLFSTINKTNPCKVNQVSTKSYNDVLDIFFDYIDLPLVNGKRHYMRQHQLRRFFAMTFFWGNGFGGMDTLRWFLGHTDVEHLYHYITESTEGSVLKSVKKQYAIDTLASNKDLIEFLKEHYNTDDITLIDKEDLDYLIEDMIDNKELTVSPEFFTDNNGVNYNIIIKVVK